MDNVFSSTYNFSEPQFDVYDRSFDEDEEEFEKRRKLYYPDCYSIIPSKEEVEHWIDNHAKKVEEIENQEANLSWGLYGNTYEEDHLGDHGTAV